MTVSNDCTAKVYDLIDKEWQKKATVQHSNCLINACFSLDGKHLVTASNDCTAKVYDLIDKE